MEAMQSLRDKIKSVKKINYEAGVDQISTSDPKPGLSKQPDGLPVSPNTQPNTQPNTRSSHEPKDTEFFGPSLPPQFGQRLQFEIRSELQTIRECLFS